MKTWKFGVYLMVVVLSVLLVQCTKEGPAGLDGLAGEDGADGDDGHITCLDCHTGLSIQLISDQFANSTHFAGPSVGYPGSRNDCAECHCHEGFVEFMETGAVANGFNNPSAWKCGTCHGIHDTYTVSDWAFRLTEGTDLMAGGTTVDLSGNSNTCLHCHQARKTSLDHWDGVAATVDVGGHDGPHHGPQANILIGELGMTTGTPGTHEALGCVGCHMGTEDGDVGGHTFSPNVVDCATCHGGITDFDWHGYQTDLQVDLDIIEAQLIVEGILDATGHLYDPAVTVSSDVFQAWWNWVVVTEDGTMGLHNPNYAQDLVDDAMDLLFPPK